MKILGFKKIISTALILIIAISSVHANPFSLVRYLPIIYECVAEPSDWTDPIPGPIRMRWRTDVICIPIVSCPYPGPYNLDVAVMVRDYFTIPEIILRPSYELDINNSPFDYIGSLDVRFEPNIAVTAKAQAASPAPPGMKWIGLRSDSLTTSGIPGEEVRFTVVTSWQNLPAFSDTTSGKIFISDNADQLYGAAVINGLADAGPASLLPKGSICGLEEFDNFEGTGFSPNVFSNQINSDYWKVTGFSDGDLNFGDFANTGDFARGVVIGPVTTGGVYKLKQANFQGLLIQPTAGIFAPDFIPGALTFRALNNSSDTLDGLDFSHQVYVRNDNSSTSQIKLSYSLDDSNYIHLPSSDITTDGVFGETIYHGVERITGVSIPPGAFIYFKWESTDLMVASFGRDEFAIGNVETSIIRDTSCDPTKAPQNLVATDFSSETGQFILSWDPVESSVGCLVSGGPVGGATGQLTVIGPNVSSVAIPDAALSPGNYIFNVKCACSTSPLVTTPVSASDTFNVPVAKISSNLPAFALSPNPVHSQLYLKIGVDNSENLVEIYDALGKLVLRTLNGPDNWIDVSALETGLYWVRVEGFSTQSFYKN